MKNNATIYYSAWDWMTVLIIMATVLVCLFSIISINVVLAITITVFLVLIEVAAFLGTYYEINDDELIVHSSFKVIKYPIAKIKKIKPTNSWLAAPAASLSKRIAITFTDKTILRNSTPLIISPVRQSEFIQQLSLINPNIEVESTLV